VRISRYAIDHPAVITILSATLLLGSLLSLAGLKQQLFAQVELPRVLIFTTWPGGSPEDVEREITNPLEDELALLSGVSEISSTSSDSLSFIMVSFTMDTVVDDRTTEIRERLNSAAGDLPGDISGPPALFKMSSSSLSAFTAAVRSELPLVTLSDYMDRSLIPRFSRIPGVGQVSLTGALTREAEVLLDPDRLTRTGLTPVDVLNALEYGNRSLPAGSVTMKKKTLNIRTDGRYSSLEEVAMTVIGSRDGLPVRIRDVAEVRWSLEDRSVLALSGGKEILMVSFDLVQEADATETIGQIKREMARIEAEQEGRLSFATLSDDSRTIELSLRSVINSALMGGILAVLILFLFLHNIRLTAIISLSIPFSLMTALAAMKLRGMSLNIMTLGGLTVAIGMIVDSSIVILENIHRHFLLSGDRIESSRTGTDEMAGAITASTMTSLAVFLPLLFLRGMIGEILRDISLTMGFALLSSLLAALVIVPFLSSQMLKPLARKNGTSPRLERIFSFMERALAWLEREYARLLERVLDRRPLVVLIAVFLLFLSLFLTRFLGFEFIPSTDMNEITLACEFPASYDLEKTWEKTALVESTIAQLAPEVTTSAFTVGGGGMLSGPADNRSYGNLQLVRLTERKRGARELINLLQEELPRRIPDLNVTVSNGGFDQLLAASTGGGGMVIDLFGNSMEDLIAASEQVKALMEREPGISKIDRSINVNQEALVIDLDHLLMGQYGISAAEAALTNRIVFNGAEAGELDTPGGQRTIRLTSTLKDGETDPSVLDRITLRGASGEPVPLGSFAFLRREKTVSAIEHRDGMKTLKVSGQLYESDVREIRGRIASELGKTDLPPGVEWEVGGSTAEMDSSFRSMLLVMAAAIFLVYTVMVIQFERFLQPLIVMASVPFTLIGVILGLLLFGSTLNVVSLLGMIALSGIVVNNAIVLIDYTNLLRSRGVPLREAVVRGGSSRLKPIVMTTLTTILGLMPIALGWGEGGKMLSSLGQAIAGGLTTSTLITLILIPVLYSLLEEHKK